MNYILKCELYPEIWRVSCNINPIPKRNPKILTRNKRIPFQAENLRNPADINVHSAMQLQIGS